MALRFASENFHRSTVSGSLPAGGSGIGAVEASASAVCFFDFLPGAGFGAGVAGAGFGVACGAGFGVAFGSPSGVSPVGFSGAGFGVGFGPSVFLGVEGLGVAFAPVVGL